MADAADEQAARRQQVHGNVRPQGVRVKRDDSTGIKTVGRAHKNSPPLPIEDGVELITSCMYGRIGLRNPSSAPPASPGSPTAGSHSISECLCILVF